MLGLARSRGLSLHVSKTPPFLGPRDRLPQLSPWTGSPFTAQPGSGLFLLPVWGSCVLFCNVPTEPSLEAIYQECWLVLYTFKTENICSSSGGLNTYIVAFLFRVSAAGWCRSWRAGHTFFTTLLIIHFHSGLTPLGFLDKCKLNKLSSFHHLWNRNVFGRQSSVSIPQFWGYNSGLLLLISWTEYQNSEAS